MTEPARSSASSLTVKPVASKRSSFGTYRSRTLPDVYKRQALHMMTRRLEVVGFTFMIPLFFVVSGMGIDVSAVVAKPLGLLAVVVGILLCRGVPVLLAEHFFDTRSGLTTRAQKAQLALYSAAGLPIIVAVTEVATSSGLLEESTASLLVAEMCIRDSCLVLCGFINSIPHKVAVTVSEIPAQTGL